MTGPATPGPTLQGQVLRLLTELGSDATLVVGPDRKVVWASPNAARILGPEGSPTEALQGRVLSQVLQDPRAGELVGRALAEETVQRGEIGHQGWRRVLRTVVAPLPEADHEKLAVVILSDITHERRLGRAHQDLIANLSHDLRTPLASLTLLAETLNGAARDDPEATRLFAGRIAAEADRLHGLVAGILDLARIEAGVEEPTLTEVDLLELSREVVAALSPQAERRQVRVEIQGSAVAASADQPRLSRALSSVLDNAIKFSHHGGVVRLEVGPGDGGPRIAVRDQGRGISAATMARIFDRFYSGDRSRSVPGSGLGLTIAKEAVELQGGGIEVSSTPGEGTEVVISLRAAPPPGG
ncbi:MAG: ATP-binding protein [Candidatus Dormibacteraeota bacterium]|nr:ATP-binding protein [Candidatus Dormibacteraeota bacterium]